MSKKKPNAKSLTMTRKDRLAYEYLSRCAECKSWVESILGIKLTSNDMHEALGNGVILCKLANSVWPGSVKSIKVTEDELFAWKSRENIGFFLDACVRNGSKPEQLFSIEDLYKQANMPRVLVALNNLADRLQKQGFKIKWPSNKEFASEDPTALHAVKRMDGLNLLDPDRPRDENDDLLNAPTSISAVNAKDPTRDAEEQQASRLAEMERRKLQDEAENALKQQQMEKQQGQQTTPTIDPEIINENSSPNLDSKKEEAALAQLKQLALTQSQEQMQIPRKTISQDQFAPTQTQQSTEQTQTPTEQTRAVAAEIAPHVHGAGHQQHRRGSNPRVFDITHQQHEQVVISTKPLTEEELVVKYGSRTKVDHIRQIIVELDKRLTYGNTCLHIAVHRQIELVVQYLVQESGVNPNVANQNGETPLHVAAAKDSRKITKLLMDAGSHINAITKDGLTPLHIGVAAGQTKQVKLLLSHGAPVEARSLDLETPLMVAIKKGHNEIIDLLLRSNARVNCVNGRGNYPIHIVAEQGSVERLEKLKNGSLVEKLDLNARNAQNATALVVGAECNSLEVVKKLLEWGANVRAKTYDGTGALYVAAFNGDLKAVHQLCLAGADPNAMNDEGWTPLHAACAEGHAEVVEVLVKKYKAKPDVLNADGTTPFFQAVATGRRAIVVFLEVCGADVNLSSDHGWTPLHISCFNEYPKLTQYLVEVKAQLSLHCDLLNHFTPLHILVSTNEPNLEMIKLLVDNGARMNAHSDKKQTPMQIAAMFGHLSVVKYLVKSGAKMDKVDDKGRNALYLAAQYGQTQIADFLSEKSGEAVPTIKKLKTLKTKRVASPINQA